VVAEPYAHQPPVFVGEDEAIRHQGMHIATAVASSSGGVEN